MTPIPVYVTDCVGDCLVIAHAAEDLARTLFAIVVIAGILVIFALFAIVGAVGTRA